jgi:hypothetical protein
MKTNNWQSSLKPVTKMYSNIQWDLGYFLWGVVLNAVRCVRVVYKFYNISTKDLNDKQVVITGVTEVPKIFSHASSLKSFQLLCYSLNYAIYNTDSCITDLILHGAIHPCVARRERVWKYVYNRTIARSCTINIFGKPFPSDTINLS